MDSCNLYPIGDGSEHWGRMGSLGKYGMIDWLRSQAAKICSPHQTETKHREVRGRGQAQGGKHPEPESNRVQTVWSGAYMSLLMLLEAIAVT